MVEVKNDSLLIDICSLQQMVGPEGAKRLFKMYLNSDKNDWLQINAAACSRNVDALRQAAHNAKGLYATLHVRSLQNLCAVLEQVPEPVDWESVNTHAAQMHEAVESLRTLITTLLDED